MSDKIITQLRFHSNTGIPLFSGASTTVGKGNKLVLTKYLGTFFCLFRHLWTCKLLCIPRKEVGLKTTLNRAFFSMWTSERISEQITSALFWFFHLY